MPRQYVPALWREEVHPPSRGLPQACNRVRVGQRTGWARAPILATTAVLHRTAPALQWASRLPRAGLDDENRRQSRSPRERGKDSEKVSRCNLLQCRSFRHVSHGVRGPQESGFRRLLQGEQLLRPPAITLLFVLLRLRCRRLYDRSAGRKCNRLISLNDGRAQLFGKCHRTEGEKMTLPAAAAAD